MGPFTPGRELNGRFFRRAVAPILASQFPRLRYTAALLGAGSEVLGYDTAVSQDHDWGPRAQLFLFPRDARRSRRDILRALRQELPATFGGFSTRFSASDSDGVRVRSKDGTPIIWIGTIPEFSSSYLHINPAGKLDALDWLVLPQQKLLSVVRGPVYHDGIGLERFRSRFRYFPRDVWLHLLAAQWSLLAEEEAFVGRAGAVQDELGARLIAARQVREIIRLAFLLERAYIPYDKWLGTAFRELQIAQRLLPPLLRALQAAHPSSRERALSQTYEIVARKQNALRIAPSLPARTSRFHDRPYRIIHAAELAKGIRGRIRDPRLRLSTSIGSVDQWSNSEKIGSREEQLEALRLLLNC
jgi:hypothetical protein